MAKALVQLGSPAHAGIDHNQRHLAIRRQGFPRTRGDRPGLILHFQPKGTFPRTRGDRPFSTKLSPPMLSVPPHTRG